MQVIDEALASEAAKYLSSADPVLAPVIASAGLTTMRPHKDYYQSLVDSIISQQLSTYAAAAIEKRFQDLFGGTFPNPEQILTKDVETLRGIGFSRGKATYVLDLAQHIVDGKVKFDHLDGLSNDEVIAELVQVKGIGEWTAHMFLIFVLNRPDVLPVGDLGVRAGLRDWHGLAELPKPSECHALAEVWRPYRSVASWYLWRNADVPQ